MSLIIKNDEGIFLNLSSLNPLNFLKKKSEEEIELPDRLEIVFTDEAQEKGTLDDFNKEIKRYKNGVVVQREKYSMAMVRAMMKIYGLPPLDLTTSKEQDYEFDEITALHGTTKRIVRI